MSGSLTKAAVNRAIRNACLAPLDDAVEIVRRDAANGYACYPTGYVAFSVQHNKYKTHGAFKFCINFGILPKSLFDAKWTGLEKPYPDVMTSLFTGRVGALHCDDRWWSVTNPERLEPVTIQIEAAVSALVTHPLWAGLSSAGALELLQDAEMAHWAWRFNKEKARELLKASIRG